MYALLQTECSQEAPGGIKDGEFVQTSAGNMTGCKMLLHGSISSYKAPDCDQVTKTNTYTLDE